MIVGLNGKMKGLGDLLDDRSHTGSLRAGDDNLLRLAQGKHVVKIQIQRDGTRRYWGMKAEIFGSQQALLFGGDGGKQNAARRLFGGGGVGRASSSRMPQPVALSAAPL